MDLNNVTLITEFYLLGFQTSTSLTILNVFFLVVIYCVTICGNLLIVTLVVYSKTLHSPMYFFLSQLSLSDILLITDIVPYSLHCALEGSITLSISNCITQFYFFAATESLECLLLTVMSYDRYVAICRPLHYTLIMNSQFSSLTVIISWSSSYFLVLIYILTISQLKFCGPNVIDHFFCDLNPMLQLSCSDTFFVQLEETSLSIIFGVIPFFVIIISYVYIIVSIMEISSMTGRQKTFSTCSSHLTVVAIFYGTMFCVYLVPSRGQSWNISKFLSLLYTVVTPLLNPIIYSLRNTDLKQVVVKIMNKVLSLTI